MFQKVSSNFQNQLKEEIKTVKKSKKLFAFADNKSNIYQIEENEYNKLRPDAITSNYKNIPNKTSNKVNADGKKIIENKEVANRIFVNSRNSCFITLKDHKPTLLNYFEVCLLNPLKNGLRKISKSIIAKD